MSLSPAVRQILAGLSAHDLAKLPDADLLARYATSRDDAAFAVLVERHGAAVLGVCRRTLGHLQDTEDAAQAVFLVLARDARRVRKPEALSAWLHGVAVRVSRKSLARRRKAEPLPDIAPAARPLEDPSWADARRVIDEALAALPESLRVPLVLCYLEGLTRDEAAARLGVPLDTFRGRLERGREKLRAALAKRGFPLAAGLLAVLLESPAKASATWVNATAALAGGHVPVPPSIASLTDGVLPMTLARYWLVGAACAALAFGGALWAAGTVPDTQTPAPRPAAAAPAEEPLPLLPKDRTGVWRAGVASPDGNSVERHAIRFVSDTELVWMTHWRSPGTDSRNGVRHKFATTATGKLQLTTLANLEGDGVTWTAPDEKLNGRSLEYTVIPLDKNAGSFSLVRTNLRGAKVWEAMFRNEADAAPADPLVPEALTKINRTIKKQPKYVNAPKYVLLVFGPEAAFKVWVAIDGDVVYIDRNGNGDLTEEGELCKSHSGTEKNVVRHASGGLTYRLPGTKRTIPNVWWFHEGPGRTGGFTGVFIDTEVSQHMNQIGGNRGFHYAPSPEQAAVIHFGSEVVTIRPSLTTSVERQWRHAAPDANGEAQVLFQVGTPGIGAGSESINKSFAAFAHMKAGHRDEPPTLPLGVDPVAEFEFTPLNPAEKPKKVTVKLSERVGQTEFGGKITVPDGVKTGLDAAKVTLSFPNCPWGKVEPVTITMDVIPKK